MKNNHENVTSQEILANKARAAALRAEANVYAKAAKEAEAALKAADDQEATQLSVTELPDEEVIVEAEPVQEESTEETPVEAEPVQEESTEETPVEAEPVQEESAEEAPVEAEPVQEESAEEAPVEAESVEEESTEETPVEAELVEEESAEEAPVEAESVEEESTEETPVEAELVEEESTEETSQDNAENQDENEDDTAGIAKVFKWLLGTIGVVALVGILIMLMLMYFGDDNQSTQDGGANTDNGVVDTTPGTNVPGTDVPGTDVPAEPFDLEAFTVSVRNIANELTDENIDTNVNLFIEKVGADKLEELVGEYGELPVQRAIAEFLAFAPEIKMNQYIRNNGLDYNPNAENDWYNKLDQAAADYKAATGKNPEGAFMSLEGYDTYKNNREAMKALIIESGDTDLLTWYEAKTTGFDLMVKQQRDTEAANSYKEEVKLELVNNVNGSVKLLELQLEQNVNGTNADTLDYAEAYEEFIISNYVYVVAN